MKPHQFAVGLFRTTSIKVAAKLVRSDAGIVFSGIVNFDHHAINAHSLCALEVLKPLNIAEILEMFLVAHDAFLSSSKPVLAVSSSGDPLLDLACQVV